MRLLEIIKNNIAIDTKIENWSLDGRIRIPYYIFKGVDDSKCCLEQPESKKRIHIKDSSFQFMYENWNDYINKKISRHELRDKDSSTTYTISLLNYLFENKILNKV